jgi:hypothetical protein
MSRTTREIKQAALAVPCPVHRVSKGRRARCGRAARSATRACTGGILADARRALAAFPPEDELGRLAPGGVMLYALWMRDAAQALSDCVDAALGLA